MSETLSLDDWPTPTAGRSPAGQALLDWAMDTDAPRLCLVTGSPGAGKSHLLAWYAGRAAEHTTGRVHALVPAEGMGLEPMVWELSEQLHWGARTVADVLAYAATDRHPLLIAVPDLHRAGSTGRLPGTRFVPDVIEPLLRNPWIRVIAETGTPSHGAFTHEATVIDLDDPRMTDPGAYAEWYGRRAGDFGPPSVPAALAFPHPALGLLAAQLPGVPAEIPPEETALDVCTAWWNSLTPAVRSALRTLALTLGPVDAATWRLLHSALRPEDPAAGTAVDLAVDRLAPQRGAFRVPLPLIGSLARGEAGSPGHASTAGSPGPTPTPQHVFETLLSLVPRDAAGVPDWRHAPPYVLGHLASHARAAGATGRVLNEPGFLVHGSPLDITAVLDDPDTAVPRSLRDAWRAAGPALSRRPTAERHRASLLHAGALATAPELARLLAPAAGRHFVTARWSWPGPPAGGSTEAAGRPGPVSAVALGVPSTPQDGLLVVADPAGTLCSLSRADGALAGDPLDPSDDTVAGLTQLTDGSLALLSGNGTLRLRAPAPGSPPPAPLARYDWTAPGSVPVTCLAGDPGGELVLLGDASGSARLYDLRAENAEVPTAAFGDTPLVSACCTRTPRGEALAVVATADGRVWLWGSRHQPLPITVRDRERGPAVVAVALTGDGPLAAVARPGGFVEVIALAEGVSRSFHAHHGIAALALTPDGLLVTAGADGITGWQCDLSATEE